MVLLDLGAGNDVSSRDTIRRRRTASQVNLGLLKIDCALLRGDIQVYWFDWQIV